MVEYRYQVLSVPVVGRTSDEQALVLDLSRDIALKLIEHLAGKARSQGSIVVAMQVQPFDAEQMQQPTNVNKVLDTLLIGVHALTNSEKDELERRLLAILNRL